MYVITEWLERYEVNDKGDQAKPGDRLRVRPLDFVRSKVHGRSRGAGFNAMQYQAKNKTYEIFGLFHKFLEIAASEQRQKRGCLLNARGEPAGIEDLSFILDTTADVIDNAMQVLTNKKVAWITNVSDDVFRKFRENPECENPHENTLYKLALSENSGNSGKIPEPYITKRNETEQNETKPNERHRENREQQQNPQVVVSGTAFDLGDLNSNSFSLRLGSILVNILNAKSKSDRSAIKNLVNWLHLQVLAKKFNEDIFQRVADIAKESLEGRNPRAMFFSNLDEAIGYRARAARQKGLER